MAASLSLDQGLGAILSLLKRYRWWPMSRLDSSVRRHGLLKTNKLDGVFFARENSMISNGRPTVVLADDHERVRNRVAELLGAECCIVASVNDGHLSVEAAERFKPDLIILDISMPSLDGIQAAQEIRRRGLACKIIFLTVQEDADYVQIANQMGASYVLKARMHVDLPLAIKAVLAEGMFVSSFSASGVIR